MRRILVLGMCGGGKSTLAARLGEILGLPVYHLDRLFWKPGWEMTPREQMIPAHQEIIAGDRWIIDGNYFNTLEFRIPLADTVIHLDFPRRVCMYRIIRRVITSYGQVRPDMGDGCPEHWDWPFMKWAWNFPRRHRPQILEAIDRYRDRFDLITFTNSREVNSWVADLESLYRGTDFKT